MKINVGIIGLGYWGPNLLRNFYTVDDSKVLICCDISPNRCEKFAMLYPGIEFSQNAEDIFNNPRVEAVVIATPVNSHYSLVKRALQEGKHVLVSKPLTNDLTQAEELVKLSEDKELVMQVDHTFIFHPAVEKLKNIIVQGELGELYYVDSVRINLGLFQHDVSVVWDLAPHDISIMEYLIDRPVRWVQAVGARHAGQKVESMAYITVQYDGNILGHCHVNWLAPMKVRLTTVGGSRRMAIYDDNLVTEKIKIYDSGVNVNTIENLYHALAQYRRGDIYAPAIENVEALEREVRHFLLCIQNRKKPITGGRAALRIISILTAAHESIINNGQRIFMSASDNQNERLSN
jgi:predicted dehydrogenase